MTNTEIEKRLEALERAVEDLKSDSADLERYQVRLSIAIDLTRQELRLRAIPDDTGSAAEVPGYDPAALLGMAPAAPPEGKPA